jgi:hypothetical protein
MRRRKWLWFAFSFVCIMALAGGYLIGAADEFAGFRALHPRESYEDIMNGERRRVFVFDERPEIVMQLLPLPAGARARDYDSGDGWAERYALPSGDEVEFFVNPRVIWPPTCAVVVFEARKPWLQRTWERIKRLRLR